MGLTLLAGAGSVAGTMQDTSTAHRVGLVVRVDDSTVITRCIEFTQSEIRGAEVLARSGLDVVTSSPDSNAAVCSIAGTGCPADACLTCDPDNAYWSYWHWQEDTWTYSGAGAGSYLLGDGDVDGWSWGPGALPDIAFDTICPPPQRVFLPLLLGSR